MKKLLSLLIILILCGSFLYSEQTSNYDDIEFPQWSKDLRRTEIITFGSLPFVTLWTTMAYNGFKYNRISNPFSKSTSSLTTSDQKSIVAYSCAVCVGLGLTDLLINVIKRNYKKSRIKTSDRNTITVMPLSLDVQIEEKEETVEELKTEPEQEYFQAGMESAIF